jgi:hypothetical protein
MGLAHGLFWPVIVGRVLLRGSPQPPEIGASIFDEDARPNILPTAPIGILFLIIGGISTPFVRLLKSLICREREWLADSEAVQFTRDPSGIAGALYFVNSSYDPWLEFLATHPPLAKRIQAVDPTFDGQFHHLKSLPVHEAIDTREAGYEQLYEGNLRRARAEAKARGELE